MTRLELLANRISALLLGSCKVRETLLAEARVQRDAAKAELNDAEEQYFSRTATEADRLAYYRVQGKLSVSENRVEYATGALNAAEFALWEILSELKLYAKDADTKEQAA